MTTSRTAGGPAGRPTRRGLTTAGVVAAAHRLIERDGLDALSMRAVAAELDTAATSPSRHVPDRESLLLAVLEQVASGLPVEVTGRTPRARLRKRFTIFHDYMAGHVWALHVLIGGALTAENALPFADACVADFRSGGLGVRSAAEAFRSCWQLTLGELLDTHPLTPVEHPTQREQLMQAIDPMSLPALAAVRDLPPRGDDTYARSIDRLIRVLLDAG